MQFPAMPEDHEIASGSDDEANLNLDAIFLVSTLASVVSHLSCLSNFRYLCHGLLRNRPGLRLPSPLYQPTPAFHNLER